MIEVKVSARKRRTWEYYLGKKYNTSRMKLERMIEMLVLKTVADEAHKETNEEFYKDITL